MVVGLDVWREHFKDFTDRYALIGGVACDTLMTEADLPFRATKDLDVVLLVEALDAAFAEAFWAFVEAGGYERREMSEGGNLYRFAKPATYGFPFMIELFSRAPDGFALGEGSHLLPRPRARGRGRGLVARRPLPQGPHALADGLGGSVSSWRTDLVFR